jgi:perosamine synthetase
MPNINAALACAQLEQLNRFVENKRELTAIYHDKFDALGVQYIKELPGAKANYWLNTVLLSDKFQQQAFLTYMNNNGIMSRPVWELIHKLPMFKDDRRGELPNSEWVADRLVNIPSSVRL